MCIDTYTFIIYVTWFILIGKFFVVLRERQSFLLAAINRYFSALNK